MKWYNNQSVVGGQCYNKVLSEIVNISLFAVYRIFFLFSSQWPSYIRSLSGQIARIILTHTKRRFVRMKSIPLSRVEKIYEFKMTEKLQTLHFLWMTSNFYSVRYIEKKTTHKILCWNWEKIRNMIQKMPVDFPKGTLVQTQHRNWPLFCRSNWNTVLFCVVDILWVSQFQVTSMLTTIRPWPF